MSPRTVQNPAQLLPNPEHPKSVQTNLHLPAWILKRLSVLETPHDLRCVNPSCENSYSQHICSSNPDSLTLSWHPTPSRYGLDSLWIQIFWLFMDSVFVQTQHLSACGILPINCADKCEFHVTSCEYLWYMLSPEASPWPIQSQIIQDWPAPWKVKDIQSSSALPTLPCFIYRYSKITVPLTCLTHKGTPGIFWWVIPPWST